MSCCCQETYRKIAKHILLRGTASLRLQLLQCSTCRPEAHSCMGVADAMHRGTAHRCVSGCPLCCTRQLSRGHLFRVQLQQITAPVALRGTKSVPIYQCEHAPCCSSPALKSGHTHGGQLDLTAAAGIGLCAKM